MHRPWSTKTAVRFALAALLGAAVAGPASFALAQDAAKPVGPERRKPTATQVAPGDLVDETPVNRSVENLPTAEEVIRKYIDAIGGESALRAKKSLHLSGQQEDFSAQVVVPFEIFRAAPNKMLMVIERPNGRRQGGNNGEVTWAFDSVVGPQVFGPPSPDSAPNFDFHRDLNYFTNYEAVEVVAREDFDGRQCYRVRLLSKGGQETFEFFDVQTGLRAGVSRTIDVRPGRVRYVDVFSDWKEVDGVLVPLRTATRSWGRGRQGQLTMMQSIEHVEFDTVDDAVFELPAEVKAALNGEPMPGAEEGAPADGAEQPK